MDRDSYAKEETTMSINKKMLGLLLLREVFSPNFSTAAVPKRAYVAGEQLTYEIETANYRDGSRSQLVKARARHTVHVTCEAPERACVPYESVEWFSLTVNGDVIPLPKQRWQLLSLSAKFELAIPDLGGVGKLVGPMTDALTFYVDASRFSHAGLEAPGDTRFHAHGQVNSWAAFSDVLLVGEDCVDFRQTLDIVNPEVVQLSIEHLPPKKPCGLELASAWMSKHIIAGTPNNWVQVFKLDHGFLAQVGHESFTVRVRYDPRDGHIISATMYNPVESLERFCLDADLQDCVAAKRYNETRKVSYKLLERQLNPLKLSE